MGDHAVVAGLELVEPPGRISAEALSELVERTGGRVGAVNVGARQARAAIPGEMHGLGESAVRLSHFVAGGPRDVLPGGHSADPQRPRGDAAPYLALRDDRAPLRGPVIDETTSVF